jgi:uncharacterized membrane protein
LRRGTHAGYYGGCEEGEDVAGGVALGSLTGGLIGLIGGPAGVVIGLVGGGAVGGAIGAAAEEDAGSAAVYDRIKQELPKGSSALILLAARPTIDDLFAAFAALNAEQIVESMTDEEVAQLKASVG